MSEKLEFVVGRVKNIMGKGENAGHQHFLLFPQCFQKASFFKDIKSHVGNRENTCYLFFSVYYLFEQVVEFGTVQKSMVRLLKQVLSEILLDHPQDKMEAVFLRIAPLVKLKKLHEGLKLFMHHFLIGKRKDSAGVNPILKERIVIVDEILSASKGHML